MSRMLYLEGYGGISGDMIVGALLDLGADRQVLQEGLESLPLGGYQVQISSVKESELEVCRFAVVSEIEQEGHAHDRMGSCGQDSEHKHAHQLRGLKEITEIFRNSKMTEKARELAVRVFQILGEAEAKVHGMEISQVRFHEVGAVDSIVDVAAAAICLDNLAVGEVALSELYEGRGCVRRMHGILPIPMPVVTNIAAEYGLKLHLTEEAEALITPVGAAISAAIRTCDRLPENFIIEKVGIGAGKPRDRVPGFLRAMLVKNSGNQEDQVCKLETNIDDCTGEALGYLMERLLKEGARDVNYMPIFMKKNRPAYQLNVICEEEDRKKLEEIIFQETTTIGIRRMQVQRTVLARTILSIPTSLGEARVKVCRLPGENRYYPEYEDAARLAREHQLPFWQVYRLICQECEEQKEKKEKTLL